MWSIERIWWFSGCRYCLICLGSRLEIIFSAYYFLTHVCWCIKNFGNLWAASTTKKSDNSNCRQHLHLPWLVWQFGGLKTYQTITDRQPQNYWVFNHVYLYSEDGCEIWSHWNHRVVGWSVAGVYRCKATGKYCHRFSYAPLTSCHLLAQEEEHAASRLLRPFKKWFMQHTLYKEIYFKVKKKSFSKN